MFMLLRLGKPTNENHTIRLILCRPSWNVAFWVASEKTEQRNTTTTKHSRQNLGCPLWSPLSQVVFGICWTRKVCLYYFVLLDLVFPTAVANEILQIHIFVMLHGLTMCGCSSKNIEQLHFHDVIICFVRIYCHFRDSICRVLYSL